MTERLEVQRAVPASASEIFAVVTDPKGHVAIDSSGMLMEASGDIVARRALGILARTVAPGKPRPALAPQ
jgi:hypothetical protein